MIVRPIMESNRNGILHFVLENKLISTYLKNIVKYLTKPRAITMNAQTS